MRAGLDFIGVNVAFHCHDGKGNILLHLRSDKCRDEHNTWDSGAGRVNFGETLEEAVTREVVEEYGCQPLEIKEITHYTNLRKHDGKQTHWLTTLYAILIDPREVKIMEPEKNLENKWYALDDLPTPLHTSLKRELDEHMSKIKQVIQK
jgi:8-oxo-dGTP diphosphatase